MLKTILALLMLATPAAALDEVRLASGRSYLIALPGGVANPPLMIALHGGGGNPAQFARASGLTAPALAAGFAIAFPAGTSRGGPFLTWNAGHCCAQAAAANVDDIGFLDAVIADAARRFGTSANVGVTGMSNGAMMAQAYAAARPGKVAAAATVAGTLDLGRFPPRGPVPVLHIHGTEDGHVPYAGGYGGEAVSPADYPSVAEMIAAFARAARRPLTQSQAVIDPARDGMRVVETRWTDASGQPFLRLLTVEGGGHAWPGGSRASRQGGTRDIDASAEVVRFLSLWFTR